MSKENDTDTLDVEGEIGAIKSILAALAPLTPSVRNNVLEYVLKRLGIAAPTVNTSGMDMPIGSTPEDIAQTASTSPSPGAVHILQFKEQKKPQSANEMAAVVAYYLGHLSPARKKTVNAKDIDDQFRIAEFPLPAQARFTLANARNAGYLDSAGGGEYQLNAVGHNLVAHSLPRGAQAGAKPRGRKPRGQGRRKSK